MQFTLGDIDRFSRGRIGQFDVACPACGPEKRSPTNRARHVLRIWRLEPGFASFHCARCGEKGHSKDRAYTPDPAKLARLRAAVVEREQATAIDRLRKARWLWSCREPIVGTVAERYLRGPRCYAGTLPGTLGFLPSRNNHLPALIAAFGIPEEPEPGYVAIADRAVAGVHITRLARDGSGKAGSGRDKIMVGKSLGSPIVLAPVNDLVGLAIAEGIEDTLSAHEATGLGAWAAGAASRMPALADAIPSYVESVTLLADDDPEGRRHAGNLAELIRRRGIHARMIFPGLAKVRT